MIFDAPLPWLEVLRLIAGKAAMPTAQSSLEISGLPAELRASSLFSARTTNAAYLEEVRQIMQQVANGAMNTADAKMNLQAWLRKVGYSPTTGFSGDEPGRIPPAVPGSLQDLSSDKRIKLVIETGASQAQSAAYFAKGMGADALFNFPCWRFRRFYARAHPRGESGKDNDPDWNERWVRSGGSLCGPDGTWMVATKDDDVWDNLSDSGLWPDGLDSDVDPVVFNTGYRRVDMPRKQCVALGVIGAQDGVQARRFSLLQGMFERDPSAVTLSEMQAKKADLLKALSMLKKAA
jgi:hypothetical protein